MVAKRSTNSKRSKKPSLKRDTLKDVSPKRDVKGGMRLRSV